MELNIKTLSIKTKLMSIIVSLIMVACIIGGSTTYSFYQFDKELTEIERTNKTVYLIEKINTLILQITMDSRGIYMTKADEKETIKKFADDINKNLSLLNETHSQWKNTLDKEENENLVEFDKYFNLFITNRSELAKVGVEKGPEEANILGNNEENRNNRKKLMSMIEEKVKSAEDKKQHILNTTDAFFHDLQNIIISFIVLSVVSSFLTSVYLIKKSITNPLLSIKNIMNRLNNGEREVIIKEINQTDEIGDMAKSIENFRLSLIENDKMTKEKERETLKQLEKAKLMKDILDNFENNIQNIVSSSKSASYNVEISAKNMVKTADNTNSQSLIVASAAEQTSMNVQTVASATEEMSASIQEISRQVSKSTEVAGRANNEAENTIKTVSDLSNTVNKIGEVVSLIQSIASQTNLLALNATIEAARAGEAGKGFAVVASEVKALATQTANATEEIRRQIENVQGNTKNTVVAMDNIQKTIQEINTISSAVAAAIEEQNATTGEITRSVQEAANGTQQVSQNIQTVSIAANETGKTANDMLKELENLENKNKDLIDNLDKFLEKIKKI